MNRLESALPCGSEPLLNSGQIKNTIEQRKLERCAAHSARKSLLRRAKARFKAGDGCGGDSSTCAKHS